MIELEAANQAQLQAKGKNKIILLLDDVRSMQNVGSLFRTADAMGIEALYICGYSPCPPHRDIQKTALGATETVTWRYFETIKDAIAYCKEQQYIVCGVEQTHNSTALQDFNPDRSKTYALILGNEVQGINDEALALCDYCIEIPQWGEKHSHNITVSAGIVLWDLIAKLNFKN